MQAEIGIALVTASAALLGSLIGYVKLRSERKTRIRELKDERDRWEQQLKDERERWRHQLEDERDRWEREHQTQLRADFLAKLVDQRIRLYPQVFKLLGGVRDIDPYGLDHDDVKQDPEQLVAVADNLLAHIYGDAGLVMSMDTRNVLLALWEDCHHFQANDVEIDTIDYGFFLARRVLRADLQLDDIDDVVPDLKPLVDSYKRSSYPEVPPDLARSQ